VPLWSDRLSTRKTVHSAIRLSSVLAIGFSGHRTLPDEAKCRRLIYDFMAAKKAATSEIICGVSSVAAGADLLFAEICLELGIPLRILLPMPREYFQQDFDAATWSRAEQVMQKAAAVEVTGNQTLREERYYECGIETVQQTQLLIVLWNGKPAQGMGGTEEIVTFARDMGKPVVWFHSETGQMQVFHEEALRMFHQDSELDFLNSLPDEGVVLSTDSSTDLAKAWLEKTDANASRLAPQVRRLAAIPIMCTAAAALVSGAGSHWHTGGVWLVAGAGLGIAAAGLPAILRLGQRQALWARTRTAAEVSRSVFALWTTPANFQVMTPEIFPELEGMLRTLSLLKALNGTPDGEPIEDFKERYIRERVSGQIEYFCLHAAQSAREARRYRLAIWACSATAVLISGWSFVDNALSKNATSNPDQKWLSLCASALFQIATIAGALLIVNDSERRQARYRELHDLLKEWERTLKAMRTWTPVLQIIGKIEKALLAELLEWKSLIRNRKMPRY
jgi:hypothetical protein